MDPELAALVSTAGTALIASLTTDGWQRVRDRLASIWRRAQPERADAVAAELEATRNDVLAARAAGDAETETELGAEWQGRVRRLLAAHPEVADELRALLAELARAEGRAHIYQASGDQHITEYHHTAPDWSGPDSVRRPAVGRIPVVVRDRAEVLDRLRAAVEPEVGDRVYVLHGLGGCGKTAVAYALFQHATGEAGRVGLWVNGSDPASLRAGMIAVAADRGASDAELTGARTGLRPAADLVWTYLDRSEEQWLLVIDNADDPSILREGGWLRSSPRGTVVVTSRQAARHWWPGAELIHFGVLPREDAALVLRDLAPHAGSVEEAAAVADRLGRLPLALTLAGGFLAHQVIDQWTLADYRLRLDSGADGDVIELVDQGAAAVGSSDSRHLVSRTWQLSIDALAGQGLPEAGELLRLFACWASDPLPLSLLSSGELGPVLPRHRIEAALRGLLDQSLVELVTQEVRCVRTHGVLLESVAGTTPSDSRESTVAAAARLVLAVLPEIPERGAQEPRVLLLAPHVLALLRRTVEWSNAPAVVERAAECALRLVTAVHRSGDYAAALALAREAATLAGRSIGQDNPWTLRLRQRWARALFRLGKFEQAESMCREVLAACETTLGPQAPDTLESCVRLALPLLNMGKGREAASLVRRAVEGYTRTLGPVHPLTLIARKCLLETASQAQMAATPEREEILAAGPATVADCRGEFGEDHPFTLGAELNYALLLSRTGQHTAALPYLHKVLTGYEEHYGPDFPLTLNARYSLSRALGGSGNREEAIRHAELLVEARTRVLGPDHPWTRSSVQHLAECRTTPPSTPGP